MRSRTSTRPALARIVIMYGIFVVCVAVGIGMWVYGTQQSPGAQAAQSAFLADPTCGRDLETVAANGSCTTRNATIVQANEIARGSVRHRSHDYVVDLNVRGERRRIDLAGDNAAAFVKSVPPGTPARVQFFASDIVRIAAAGMTAETTSAPDVIASGTAQMPWIGMLVAALGLVFGIAATALLRRRASFA